MDPNDSTKPCTKCARVLPYSAFYTSKSGTPESHCKECRKRASREWKKANPEKARAAEERWRKEHQSWVNERSKRNQEKRGQEGREKRNAYLRAYRAANPERTAAKLRAYSQRYPEKVRARCAKRRARIKGAPVRDFTVEQWNAIKAAYKNCCAYCGKRKPLTIDHVIPLSKGGNHTASNIVPACRSCNGRKWANNAPTFQPMLVLPDGEDV